jgi:hypothetical protein
VPLMKKVGVPLTPLLKPPLKSSRTVDLKVPFSSAFSHLHGGSPSVAECFIGPCPGGGTHSQKARESVQSHAAAKARRAHTFKARQVSCKREL